MALLMGGPSMHELIHTVLMPYIDERIKIDSSDVEPQPHRDRKRRRSEILDPRASISKRPATNLDSIDHDATTTTNGDAIPRSISKIEVDSIMHRDGLVMEVPRVSPPSLSAFHMNYMLKQQPVIITNAMQAWCVSGSRDTSIGWIMRLTCYRVIQARNERS